MRRSYVSADKSKARIQNIINLHSYAMTPHTTGAHTLIATLFDEGVDTIFGYPGGSIMPAYDALYDSADRMRHVLVRHEQAAAHAAEGYAHTTGKVGVCFATSGPGATNLLTGITNAMMDSTPLVCITGQVNKALLGTDAFQESPIISMAAPVTKWCTQVHSADMIKPTIERALRLAQHGRPGPVLIDITKNALMEVCEERAMTKPCSPTEHPLPSERELRAAADLLNHAARPYALIGHGVLLSGAQEALRTLLEKANIPCAATTMGLGAIPHDHPLYYGMLGMHGNYATNLQTNEADVILAIGMRFDDRVTGNAATYARHAKIIHIDIDPAELNKIITPEVALTGDAKAVLEALTPYIKPATHEVWHGSFRTLDRLEDPVRTQALTPGDGPLSMAEVIRALDEATSDTAIVVADVGQHQMLAARYYRLTGTRRFITSGGLGTMGFSLPAAIGAAVSRPDRQVIALMGDGGAQMNIQELGTIMQEHIPVKILILNNHHLGMVRQWQELFYEGRYSSVSIESPDFVALAAAYRIPGESVTERADLKGALETFVYDPNARLLEVRVRESENVFPMIPGGGSVSDIRLA
jgi:acetolactate synthase I/II/III large subunit